MVAALRSRLVPLLALVAFVACDDPVTPADDPLIATQLAANTNTLTGEEVGTVDAVFPSTNEANYANGWAHVLFVDVGVGQVTLEFVQPRGFAACFEYRIDNGAPTGDPNYNGDITDGLWEFTCQNASSLQMTFSASQYVDIRMGFGAESDERFDWTRFYVLSLENKDQCKNGEWEALGFKNQGQCVRYVETGKDSRTGG